jgi:hypothetical protein
MVELDRRNELVWNPELQHVRPNALVVGDHAEGVEVREPADDLSHYSKHAFVSPRIDLPPLDSVKLNWFHQAANVSKTALAIWLLEATNSLRPQVSRRRIRVAGHEHNVAKVRLVVFPGVVT